MRFAQHIFQKYLLLRVLEKLFKQLLLLIQHALKKLPLYFFSPLFATSPISLQFCSASCFMGYLDFNWAVAPGCTEIFDSHLAQCAHS